MRPERKLDKETTAWIALFTLEMREKPQPNQRLAEAGKTKLYSESYIYQMRTNIRRFMRFIDCKASEINPQHIDYYCQYLVKNAISPNCRYVNVINVQKFVGWLYGKGAVAQDMTALLWNDEKGKKIAFPPPSRIRTVPIVDRDKLTDLRKSGNSARDRAIMSMIFFGYRLSEINWLDWSAFPEGYFSITDPFSQPFRAQRKRGKIWNCVIDKFGFGRLKELWLEAEMPTAGPVFVSVNNNRLDTMSINRIFSRSRDRIFYRPEDRNIRKYLTPHCIRHIWAQNFRDLDPALANAVGAVVGGWEPGSKVYRDRYLNPANTYHITLSKNMPNLDLFPGRKDK